MTVAPSPVQKSPAPAPSVGPAPLKPGRAGGRKNGQVRKRLGAMGRLLLLCVVGFSFAVPFVWMVCASFKNPTEVEKPNLLPEKDARPANYPVVLGTADDPATGQKMDLQFGRWYFNSLFITVGITLLQVLTSAMAAYAFSRIRWYGRDTVFFLYLATIMIPGVVTMIPNFQVMVSLHFINTYHGLIIPAAFSAFGTFLLRQFMIGIPQSFDEAASLDGASHWQIFWDVILPLARPGLIALGIITFLGAYQSFFWPLILLHSQQMYTLPVGMLAFNTTHGQRTELIMAATVMNILPLIVIFVIFQKFLVKGLRMGGVKG